MHIRMAAVAACVLTLGGSPARADIIQAVFTGVVAERPGVPLGFYMSPTGEIIPESSLFNLPYTATFKFDTSLGALTHPSPGVSQLTQGLISATFSLPTVETFTIINNFGTSFLVWSDDLLTASASARGLSGSEDADIVLAGSSPLFEKGICPGNPCGLLQIDSVAVTNLSAAPVPGPLVGSGLPGILFGLFAAMRMYRRRCARSPDR